MTKTATLYLYFVSESWEEAEENSFLKDLCILEKATQFCQIYVQLELTKETTQQMMSFNHVHSVDSSTTTLWTDLFPIAGCLVSFYNNYVLLKLL